MKQQQKQTGIRRRHSKTCSGSGRCDCSWEASIYSKRDRKQIKKTFAAKADAIAWRADAGREIRLGLRRAPTKTTIHEAAETWLAGAESGTITNRSRRRYKPATLRGYRQALDDRIYPEIGNVKLSEITTTDLQWFVERWLADGLDPSTVRNTIKPLQAIYRRAVSRGGLPRNPTIGLELPPQRPQEVEIVDPPTAVRLIEATPKRDRAIWATAVHAGLRLGELRALRWGAVDLAEGRIEVRESWDPKQGPIEPKTAKSRRTIKLAGVLRDHLLDHKISAPSTGDRDLVFGTGTDAPFYPNPLYKRADKAWAKAGIEREDGKPLLRLHQARHTFASFGIAAGIPTKVLSAAMGHTSVQLTEDLYAHLLPDAEDEFGVLLDRFLAEQTRAPDSTEIEQD